MPKLRKVRMSIGRAENCAPIVFSSTSYAFPLPGSRSSKHRATGTNAPMSEEAIAEAPDAIDAPSVAVTEVGAKATSAPDAAKPTR